MSNEILHSEFVYRGKAFSVRKDQVRLPNGHVARLDIVDHAPAVTLLPVDDRGQIWFIRQYRHATGGEILELPAGVVGKNENPEACARREVREEIGMSAASLELIGEFYLAPGYSTEYMYVYLATGLKPDPLPSDEDEFIRVERVAIATAYRWVDQGQIRDAKSLAALLLAQSRLGNV